MTTARSDAMKLITVVLVVSVAAPALAEEGPWTPVPGTQGAAAVQLPVGFDPKAPRFRSAFVRVGTVMSRFLVFNCEAANRYVEKLPVDTATKTAPHLPAILNYVCGL